MVDKDSNWLVTAIILLQALIIILINNSIVTSTNLESLQANIPYFNFFILTIGILNIAAIKKIEENAQYKAQVLLFKNHFNGVDTLLESLRTQKHDYVRHMQTIQALIELEKIGEAQDYIDGITQQYWPQEDIYEVGHPALTGLINGKRCVAEMKGIDFTVAVKCDLSYLSVPAWDLCSIMGNLLDNAMEAAIQDENHPRIGVEFKCEDGYYAIYILNNGATIPRCQDIFAAGYTTRDSVSRGYGLYLVKMLVDKYNGHIEISSQERTTTILKLPRGEELYDASISQQQCQQTGE
jgi:sensor histidine kinase regulating citrate/malate metabolism